MMHQIRKIAKQIIDSKNKVLNLLLWPVSIIYLAVSSINYYVMQSPRKINAKIICVGNITIGGSGKTPLCIYIYQMLCKIGCKNIAYVSRGYGSELANDKEAILVTKNHSGPEVGDEPMLLSQFAPTYICKNKYIACSRAANDGAKIIILDDGMQNNTIKKDISIIAVNAEYRLGNNYCIPAGPLREMPYWAFKRCDLAIFVQSTPKIDIDFCNNFAKQYNVDYIIAKRQFVKLPTKATKCIVMCAIARPENFTEMIVDSGIEIIKAFIYPDHHNFSNSQIQESILQSKKLNAPIFVTSKDMAKIPNDKKQFFKAIECELYVHKAHQKSLEDIICTRLKIRKKGGAFLL